MEPIVSALAIAMLIVGFVGLMALFISMYGVFEKPTKVEILGRTVFLTCSVIFAWSLLALFLIGLGDEFVRSTILVTSVALLLGVFAIDRLIRNAKKEIQAID